LWTQNTHSDSKHSTVGINEISHRITHTHRVSHVLLLHLRLLSTQI